MSWTVRAGERWAVVGPNGSGKTTLLSLLCGDHPQAYANDIRLFGRRRGTGETIWDVKRNVGLVSPEFHLYFTEPLTATAPPRPASSTALPTAPPRRSRTIASRNCSRRSRLSTSRRAVPSLSTGEQRLVLLAGAGEAAELVILDEPFQSLDAEAIELAATGSIANWVRSNADYSSPTTQPSYRAA